MEKIYNNALRLMEGGLYEEAADEFGRIPDYRDSRELREQCLELASDDDKDRIYAAAVKASLSPIVSGQEKAINLFRRIPGWRDSDQKIREAEEKIVKIRRDSETERARARAAADKEERRKKLIRRIIILASVILVVGTGLFFGGRHLYRTKIEPRLCYNRAMALIEKGNDREAYLLLRGIDYLDSADQVARIVRDELKAAAAGNTVLFGMYEQDENRLNGKEPIEWIVLKKEGSRLLLVTKYAVEGRPVQADYLDVEVCWATSDLRKWLNRDFLTSAFSSGERKIIHRETAQTPDNPYYACIACVNTKDYLFIPSAEELELYFPTEEDRLLFPTLYASRRRGAYGGPTTPTWWWLRTSGMNDVVPRMVVVSPQGDIIWVGHYTDNRNYSVRPMTWVELGSE